MSQAHRIQPTAPSADWLPVRLGGTATPFNYADVGKAVKLSVGNESQFDLCAAGDPIEAIVTKVTDATSGGFVIGAIDDSDRVFAIADGSEAAGTGALAVGDYVVCGTVVARNTALSSAAPYLKVRKATVQIGAVPASLTEASRQSTLVAAGAWRVESLGPVGTGAVGTMICIAPTGKKL